MLWLLVLCLAATAGATTTFLVCESDAECSDGIACTLDSCDLDSGYCLIVPESNTSACTSISCMPKFCEGGSRAGTACARQDDCPGGACVGYQCNGGGYDGSACAPGFTSASWDSTLDPEAWVFHFCQYGGGLCESDLCYLGGEVSLENCNDGSVCTIDYCNATAPLGDRCQHTTLSCDDGDDCNGAETCDPILGCQSGTPFMPANCSDGIACSIDICDLNSSSCRHDYSQCPVCGSDTDCDDDDATTDDFCVTGRCEFSGAPCSVECMLCGAGDACVALNYSACIHIPLFCPAQHSSSWYWPGWLALLGIMVSVTCLGWMIGAQRRDLRDHDHHHDGQLPERWR
jgi:hypothetical protein